MANYIVDDKKMEYAWDEFMEDLKTHSEIFMNLFGNRIAIFPLRGKIVLVYGDNRWEFYSLQGVLKQKIHNDSTIKDLWGLIELEEVF